MYNETMLLAHRETEVGVIRSNPFKVKDVEAFTEWFRQYHFGYGVTVQTEAETRRVCFGGNESEPSAYPQQIITDDCLGDYIIRADLAVFAREFAGHLEPGEAVSIMAVESVYMLTEQEAEEIPYLCFSQLVIAADYPDRPVFRDVCSLWGKDCCAQLIETGKGPSDR
jgi:hypothetical protein